MGTMRIGILNKRAVYSAGRRAARNGAFGRKLKIMIRCGLLREGFQGPLLIFRKAKGFKALNPTTRICGNNIFNQYFNKQIITHYFVLNRFYKQAAEFEKPSGSRLAAGQSLPILFPPMSADHYVYADRIQYLNRLLGRHENRDAVQKNWMFFRDLKTIQNVIRGEHGIIIPEKKNGKSTDPGRIVRRAEAGQTEPAPGLPDSETELIVREVFFRKEREGSMTTGMPKTRTAFIDKEPSAAQRTVYVSEKPGSPERFLAKDRIFRMIAECSTFKSVEETGQAGFSAQSFLLFPDGAGRNETGSGRIERFFSDGAAVMIGNKGASPFVPPQADTIQASRLVAKQENQVLSRGVSDGSIGVPISRRFNAFRQAVRNPDRTQPIFSRTGFGQDHDGTQALGKSGALEAGAARIIKKAETHEMKSALKRPALDRTESAISRAEEPRSEAFPAATGIRNRPADERAVYWNIKREGAQSVLRGTRADASIYKEYTAQGTRYPFSLPETDMGDRTVSGTSMAFLKTTRQNKRFMMQIVAQTHRILSRREQTNIVNSNLRHETDRQDNGQRRIRSVFDPVSISRGQAKTERPGVSSPMSFSGRVAGEPGFVKESRSGFTEAVYQSQGNDRVFSAGPYAASAPNVPVLGPRGPEFVFKKESTPAGQTPAVRPIKETAVVIPTAQTLYDSDAKKKQNREMNVIADRVYQMIEKRIAIEKDRRGLI